MTRTCALILVAAALASCAPVRSTMQAERDAQIAECEARGGVLVPIPGPPRSGNERANNVCEIRGGASRIPR